MMVNRSSYTITRVEAQFCTGTSLVTHRKSPAWRVSRTARALSGQGVMLRTSSVTTDVLTPWNAGVRFESDEIHTQNLSGPLPDRPLDRPLGNPLGAQAGSSAADPRRRAVGAVMQPDDRDRGAQRADEAEASEGLRQVQRCGEGACKTVPPT